MDVLKSKICSLASNLTQNFVSPVSSVPSPFDSILRPRPIPESKLRFSEKINSPTRNKVFDRDNVRPLRQARYTLSVVRQGEKKNRLSVFPGGNKFRAQRNPSIPRRRDSLSDNKIPSVPPKRRYYGKKKNNFWEVINPGHIHKYTYTYTHIYTVPSPSPPSIAYASTRCKFVVPIAVKRILLRNSAQPFRRRISYRDAVRLTLSANVFMG